MSPPTSRIAERFAELKRRGEVALIPYLTAGDPDLETTAQALLALDASGADLIELGIPYSGPLADGPVIQAAATRALGRGTTLEAILAMLSRIGSRMTAPVVLFTYYNPVLALGVERFLDRARAAGASGLVVPDLPLEEGEFLQAAARERNLDVIWLVAPTSPPERAVRIAAAASGFVYLVSTTGVTGVRARLAEGVRDSLARLRGLTELPLAVGFGIGTPEQARQVAEWGADGVVVGSALVKLLAETPAPDRIAVLAGRCASLKEALRIHPN